MVSRELVLEVVDCELEGADGGCGVVDQDLSIKLVNDSTIRDFKKKTNMNWFGICVDLSSRFSNRLYRRKIENESANVRRRNLLLDRLLGQLQPASVDVKSATMALLR